MKGQIGWYVLRVDNPDDSARIAKAIDTMYHEFAIRNQDRDGVSLCGRAG